MVVELAVADSLQSHYCKTPEAQKHTMVDLANINIMTVVRGYRVNVQNQGNLTLEGNITFNSEYI